MELKHTSGLNQDLAAQTKETKRSRFDNRATKAAMMARYGGKPPTQNRTNPNLPLGGISFHNISQEKWDKIFKVEEVKKTLKEDEN